MYSILGYRLYPFYDFNGRKLMKDFWISSPGSRSWKCHQLIESAWFLIFNDVKNKILLKICSKSRSMVWIQVWIFEVCWYELWLWLPFPRNTRLKVMESMIGNFKSLRLKKIFKFNSNTFFATKKMEIKIRKKWK